MFCFHDLSHPYVKAALKIKPTVYRYRLFRNIFCPIMIWINAVFYLPIDMSLSCMLNCITIIIAYRACTFCYNEKWQIILCGKVLNFINKFSCF